MDIGKLKNNNKFYEPQAYIYDDEVILSLKEAPEFNLHIWDLYFDDIFNNSLFKEREKSGFTRDFQEGKGAFSDENQNYAELQNPEEYLADLLQYTEKEFEFKETNEVFQLIANFLRYAIATKQTVIVEVE